MKTNKHKSGIIRLLGLSGNRKGLLILSAITITIHALMMMVPYLLIFFILKALMDGKTSDPDIRIYLIWAFVSLIVSAIMVFASAIASHIAAFNILYELRCKISDKLGRLPMGYLQNRSSGALKKILSDDVERVEKFIAHNLPDTIKAIVLPLVTLGYLFSIDWRLAMVSLLPFLVFVVNVPAIAGSKAGKERVKKYHSSLEEMNACIVEFVRAMPVMKIFGQSASAFSKYSDAVHEFEYHLKEWNKMTAPVWAVIMSFLTNALLPLLVFGLYLYFKSGLELPVLFLFLILGVGYIRPAFKLASIGPQISMITRGLGRVDEILFEINEQKGGKTPPPSEFSLEFCHAGFAYIKGTDVIKDVSFKVPQGSITALVGPSGSGKSTIGQLIARFYDLDSGTITIGAINITDLSVKDLMNIVGFVFQDNMMFRQSIYDNICMGMDKSKDEVMAAAKTARCHDFIMALPRGYDTLFGDSGVHLSGGEQQRIQLARVVLKDPPILVLDEATAFSDPENEHLIMNSINELITDKTVVIIAHRLSTIAGVDQIVVMNNGRVDALGRHEKLLETNRLYSQMWDAHTRARNFEIVTYPCQQN